MKTFQDHFSKQAREYARYRPRYPAELFAYLASVAPGRRLAWDCGTGSGQAAHGLVAHFDRVVASDASPDQLAQAVPHERIEYRLVRAEEIDLGAGEVDLVTVATALHWFDLPRFYETVRRVAATDGVIAAWTYHMPVIEPGIDPLIEHFYFETVGEYWPESFRWVTDHYRSLPFPFEEIASPGFEVRAEWDRQGILGFLDSWSATQRYRKERGADPVEIVRPALVEAWGEADRRRVVRFPIYLRVGRVRP